MAGATRNHYRFWLVTATLAIAVGLATAVLAWAALSTTRVQLDDPDDLRRELPPGRSSRP